MVFLVVTYVMHMNNVRECVYHPHLRYLEVTSSMCQHTNHSDMALPIWTC